MTTGLLFTLWRCHRLQNGRRTHFNCTHLYRPVANASCEGRCGGILLDYTLDYTLLNMQTFGNKTLECHPCQCKRCRPHSEMLTSDLHQNEIKSRSVPKRQITTYLFGVLILRPSSQYRRFRHCRTRGYSHRGRCHGNRPADQHALS